MIYHHTLATPKLEIGERRTLRRDSVAIRYNRFVLVNFTINHLALFPTSKQIRSEIQESGVMSGLSRLESHLPSLSMDSWVTAWISPAKLKTRSTIRSSLCCTRPIALRSTSKDTSGLGTRLFARLVGSVLLWRDTPRSSSSTAMERKSVLARCSTMPSLLRSVLQKHSRPQAHESTAGRRNRAR